MANSCFKKLNASADIFTRFIKNEQDWQYAYYWQVPQDNNTFKDKPDSPNKYYFSDIFRISVHKNMLQVYIYTKDDDDENIIEKFPPNCTCVDVTDKDEIQRILNYLNQNKCNK